MSQHELDIVNSQVGNRGRLTIPSRPIYLYWVKCKIANCPCSVDYPERCLSYSSVESSSSSDEVLIAGVPGKIPRPLNDSSNSSLLLWDRQSPPIMAKARQAAAGGARAAVKYRSLTPRLGLARPLAKASASAQTSKDTQATMSGSVGLDTCYKCRLL